MDEKQEYRPFQYNVNPHQWNLYSRRATYKAYQRYGINKYELWFLSVIYGCLQTYGRPVIGRKTLFDHVTANSRFRRKMAGYYMGLLEHGMIGTYEYVHLPGSEAVGISDKGMQALRCWEEEFLRLIKSNVIKQAVVPVVNESFPRYSKTA